MLRLMLDAHSRLAIPFESNFLAANPGRTSSPFDARAALNALQAEPFTQRGEIISDPEAVLTAQPDSFASLVDGVFSAWAQQQGKVRWGVKMPSYVTRMDELGPLFPHARFIHIVRDGRDVALSMTGLSWGTRHIPTLAEDWRWMTVLGRKMGNLLGDRYHELRYEDLVRDPESHLRAICEFLDEPFDPQMLAYSDDATKRMPAESMRWHASSVSPPDESKIDRWRTGLTKSDQIIYEQIAGGALRMFGYERLNHSPTLASRGKGLYYALLSRW